MKQKIAVTVCIPVRNAEKYISFTIDNILKNSFSNDNYEILICNHGSTDGTAEILKLYSERYDNISFFTIAFDEPNRPLARNNIIKHAKGDILIFIDQDILVSSDFIKSHVDIHKKYNGCIVAGYTFAKDSMSNLIKLNEDGSEYFNFNNITQDYSILQSKEYLKDSRICLGYIKETSSEQLEDLTDTISPFIAFWLCNLSVNRNDIINLKGFDEHYKAWGLDDEDIAYRYQLDSRKMFFSRQAWAYHIPHSVNVNDNIATWRQNCDYFFKKYLTRELELFTIFKGHIDKGAEEIQLTLDVMPKSDEYNKLIQLVSSHLLHENLERLGILINGEEFSTKLGLTQCFNPFTALNSRKYQKNNCTYWPLIGFRTSFENSFIDETIVIVDLLMFFEDYLLKILLLEIARVSKKVIVFYGSKTNCEHHQYLVGRFNDILELIKFNLLEKVVLEEI